MERSSGGCARRRGAEAGRGGRGGAHAETRGIGTRSGAMRAARAAGERREAAIADRLARVVRRVDAAFGPGSTASSRSIRKTRSSADPRSRLGAPVGRKPRRAVRKPCQKALRFEAVDSALVALERRVDALARAAASGAPMTPTTRAPPGVPPARSALREAPLEGGALELTSLRRMMRAAQTELGALSGRVEAVETKVREAGRLERDLRSARLTEKRAEERQNRTSVERSVAADAARASERAAAAARDGGGERAQYAEVAESVGSQREGLRRVVSRMDGLARDVDVSARSAEAAADAPGRRRGPPSPPPKAPSEAARWPARSEGSRGTSGCGGWGTRCAPGCCGRTDPAWRARRGSGTGGGVGGQVRDHCVRDDGAWRSSTNGGGIIRVRVRTSRLSTLSATTKRHRRRFESTIT